MVRVRPLSQKENNEGAEDCITTVAKQIENEYSENEYSENHSVYPRAIKRLFQSTP